MWLKINADGFEVYLHLSRGFCESNVDYDAELTIEYGKDVKIRPPRFMLFADEVKHLQNRLRALLTEGIQEAEIICFTDPGFAFILEPRTDAPQDEHEKDGFEIVVDFRVYFWNGRLTQSYLSLRLHKENVERLLCYLDLITGQRRKADTEGLIERGIILDYRPWNQ